MAQEHSHPSRLAAAALGFAVAGALAAWNPLAAPFGLIVGVASAFLAGRALMRRQGKRWLAQAALVLGIADGLASVAMLLLSAGVLTPRVAGQHVVTPRTPAELKALLDSSAESTSEARARSSRELDQLSPRRGDGRPGQGAARDRAGEGGAAQQHD